MRTISSFGLTASWASLVAMPAAAQFTMMEVELQEDSPAEIAMQLPITYLLAGILIVGVIGLVLYAKNSRKE